MMDQDESRPPRERFQLWGSTTDKRQLVLSYEHHMLKGRKMPVGDWEVIAAYDKPKYEARTLSRECGIMEVSFFTFIRVTGSEAHFVLSSLLTRDLTGMRPGEGRRALVLDDKTGNVAADIEVVAMGDSFLLIAPPTVPPDRLIARLTRNLLAEDIDFADAGDNIVSIALLGENRGWLARSLGLEAPIHNNQVMRAATVGASPVNVIRTDYLGGALMLVTKHKFGTAVWSKVITACREVGGAPVGYEAFQTWRIERGITWPGADYELDATPVDLGLDEFCTPNKSGYPGHVHHARSLEQGRQRQFVGLIIDANEPPPAGTPIRDPDGLQAGTLKSVAFSTRINRHVGLGLVRRRERPPRHLLLAVDGETIDAQVSPLPFPPDPSEQMDEEF